MMKWLEDLPFSELIMCAVTVVIAVALIIIAGKVNDVYSKRDKKGEKKAAINIIYGIVRLLIIVIALLTVLEIFGVNVSSALAGLGIISAIVGLALQDYIKDIIMGIHIVLDHFFVIGECVEYMGSEGVILSFSLRTTKIGDLDDHSVLTVRNSNITEIRRLGERMDIDVPLSYNESPAKIHEIMLLICKRAAELENVNECEYKGTQQFCESSVLYKIRVFCEPSKRPDVRRNSLRIIQDELEKASMHIPFNQLDVHFDK